MITGLLKFTIKNGSVFIITFVNIFNVYSRDESNSPNRTLNIESSKYSLSFSDYNIEILSILFSFNISIKYLLSTESFL